MFIRRQQTSLPPNKKEVIYLIGETDLNSYGYPDCPRCGSRWVIKDGRYKRRGKQTHRYRCKRCSYRFVKPRAELFMKAWAVHAYTQLGITLQGVANELKQLFKLVVSHTTIRNWFLKTKVPAEHVKSAIAGTWHVDETIIHSNGEKWWIWIVTDRHTRCVLAWHVSNNRRKKNAKIALEKAIENAGGEPTTIISDGYMGYASIFKQYPATHIIDSAFGLNALIERLNREIKKRLKWFKCNVSRELVETLLALWFHAYHHRFHYGLGCTPMEAATSTKL